MIGRNNSVQCGIQVETFEAQAGIGDVVVFIIAVHQGGAGGLHFCQDIVLITLAGRRGLAAGVEGLVHQGGGARRYGGGHRRAGHGLKGSAQVGAGQQGPRRQDVQAGAALGETGDPVGGGSVIDGAALPGHLAVVAGPHGADGHGETVHRRIPQALLAVVGIEAVARGRRDEYALALQGRKLIVQKAIGVGGVVPRPQGHVDGDDVVSGSVVDDPAQGVLDGAEGAGAIGAQNLEGDEIDRRGDAGVRGVGRADDAGHVGAVAVVVQGIAVVVDEIPAGNDALA